MFRHFSLSPKYINTYQVRMQLSQFQYIFLYLWYCPFSKSTFRENIERSPLFLYIVLQTPSKSLDISHYLRDISIPTGTLLSVYCPFSNSTFRENIERSPLFLYIVLQTPSKSLDISHYLRDISIPTGTLLSVYCPFSNSTFPRDIERSPPLFSVANSQ